MSVLRINQNPIAVNANRNLRVTGTSIARSLERLSSGLRINRAADDAAGLSISEKLRGQIRGLNRASSNALDGISLIQTAEGALDEMHTILQRMRELAVQAANGIYSAGDRQAIQLEVAQLTDEINRIARTTEFNTKRLLDGTLGALVSTDDNTRIRAAVTGNVGDGGNFVLKAVAKTTGQLQVLKTDVFTTSQKTDAVGQINYLATWRAGAIIKTANASGTGNTGIYQIEIPYSVGGAGSIAVNSSSDGTLTVSGALVAAGGQLVIDDLTTEEVGDGDVLRFTFQTPNGVQTFDVVLNGVAALTNNGLAAAIAAALGGAGGGILDAAGSVVFSASGAFAITSLATGVDMLGMEFVDSDGNGSDFYLSFSAKVSVALNTRVWTSNLHYNGFTYGFSNNGATTGPISIGTAAGAPRSGYADTSRGYFSIGDATTGQVRTRFSTHYDWSLVDAATAGFATDTIAWNKYTGGNSLQDYGHVWQTGPVPSNDTFLVSAVNNREFAMFEFNNALYSDRVAAGIDQNTALAQARGIQLLDYLGNATFSIGATFRGAGSGPLENVRFAVDGILQAGETATFNMSTDNVVTADQLNTLASLNRFQEFNVFNGRKSVELEVYLRGTDKRAAINLSTNDTLEDVAGKISLALWNANGTGIINSGILNPQQLPDLVHVNTIGVAKGTMSIVSPVPGSQIVFAADETLLKALSLVEVRAGESPIYSISAFNIELNKSVGETRVDSNEIEGLLPGLRIYFDNTLGLRLDPQPPTDADGGPNDLNTFAFPKAFERPVISLAGQLDTFFMHVAPRDFFLQTGANQGQQISSFIADHSAQALGVEGLLIVTSELAQEAITVVDVAITRVSTQRSRLGAIQNRLESTIRNLDVAAENLTASESRIRDTDIAQETVTSTRNQILLQAGVAALAQANQLPQAVLQLLR